MQSVPLLPEEALAAATGRVLAVDDNDAQRSSIVRSLRQAGFDVVEAASGEDALASLARNPDVVVLDACLPGIGGREVCRRIKLDPKTSGIPVLQVASGPKGHEEGLGTGGDAYLPGPLHPSELVAVVRALLRMRRAEEEARRRTQDADRSRAELNAVLDSIGEGLCQLDVEGRLLYMNPAAERILGQRTDDVQGCFFHGLVHPDAEAHMAGECSLARVLNGDSGQRLARDFFRRHDGSLFPVECATDPIVIAGKITGMVLSFRDVSDRQRSDGQCFLLLLREQAARRGLEEKTAEVQKLNAELEARVRQRTAELEAANRELEAFSYSVSHDLRAPLRSISGYAQVLLEGTTGLDPAAADLLRRLCAASRHLGQVIESLLQLSRVTCAEIQREEVDLSALARGIALELRRAQPRRAVRFRQAAGLVARGDPSLLQIVLENLLGNAWKFTSRRRTARIEFGRASGKPANVYFVRDNGVGFDMAQTDKLFTPFRRLHPAGEFDGCGIGLATVARIIRRHGGDVWAEAKPGRGATFFFSLP